MDCEATAYLTVSASLVLRPRITDLLIGVPLRIVRQALARNGSYLDGKLVELHGLHFPYGVPPSRECHPNAGQECP